MTNLAVLLIGLLSLVNLMLTFAVIRQVRRFGERSVARTQPTWHLQAGHPVPDFSATAVSGERVSLSDLVGGRSVIAFFSVGCPPCRAEIPEFTRYARSFPGGAAQVLAVVLSRGELSRGERPRESTDDYVREFAGVATVVVEPAMGAMAQTFSVSTYPTIYVVDEQGRVETSAMAARRLAVADPV